MRGTIARILGAIAVLAVLAAAVKVGTYALWDIPATPSATPQRVLIPTGTSLRSVSHTLQSEGILRSAIGLELLGRWRGQAARIHPGEYALSAAMTPREILDALVRGDILLHAITLPEGLTAAEMTTRLAAAGFGHREHYDTLLQDRVFARALGIHDDGFRTPFEGYLFPSTYRFPQPVSSKTVIRTLVHTLDSAFPRDVVAQMAQLGWDRHRVLTLASLIEKETGAAVERPRISSVFHNRLGRRMRLQSDPTVIYAIPQFDGNIRRRDLDRKHPYNTYQMRGLPPGPIANPGAAAIRAAVFPMDDDALYFVSRGDGTHYFSRSNQEHQRAVRRFRP